MSLSIKIPKEKKLELEKLQTRILEETGKKIDLQELLGMAVDLSAENYASLIKKVLFARKDKSKIELSEILSDYWKIADVPLISNKTDDEIIYE